MRAAAIHGDRSQGQRERALAAFQHGQVQALVATDVAARGIHVDDVDGVIHLDPPADEKDYVHRSGRTGRAGAQGTVVSFVAPELRKDVAALQRALKRAPGLTQPDVAALVAGARPAKGPRPSSRSTRPERSERSERPESRSGPRPGARSGPKGHASSKPARAGSGSKRPARAAGKPGSSSRSSSSRSASSRSTTSRTSAASPAPGGNRKSRRAHLQPGASTPAGPSSAKSRRSRRGADVGKRRQPSRSA